MSNDDTLQPGLHIELIDPDTIYELNDFINGILTLELNKRLSSKCILIKLKCIGEVQWLLPSNTQLDQFLKQRENFLNTNYNVEKSEYDSIGLVDPT